MHFNWTQLIPGVTHSNVHVATALLASFVIIVLSFTAKLALGNGQKAVTPSDRLSIKGFFELIIEFIIDVSVMVCGESGRKFAPIFASIFFFILLNNYMGVLPGMTPATDNINTTVAVGLFSFLAYNYMGFKEHGISYLKQFLGPLLLIAPLMLVIELISHLVRPISLGLRLQGNMVGDHAVLGVFLNLVPYFVPAIFYLLGFFVCFMQAFVFTMLTMIYVSMAVSHDH
ncbi:MAG: F0F1 ATP synthase subunit A [Bdellovibrionaceae bacterium]|jgi:F-type H+-transporting ATPase subunit a|nr:F0F1 ATP synthase subunit A [Pseudobdellovibrionaceae bacterium]